MTRDEYVSVDAVALAGLVRKKEVTPLELVDRAIAEIERSDRALNAVVFRRFEEARAEAKEKLPDGPFRGVPFLVKDLFNDVAGTPTCNGSRFCSSQPQRADSPLVRRYREAGFIVLGKTNTSELGLAVTTEPERFGATKNPWDLHRSPGGSSGGSAAAVAARMVPMAGASDAAGSIRIPSACCGVFGLKPSRFLTREADTPAAKFAVEHVVSRSVRDSAAMLDWLAVPSAGRREPFLQEGAGPGRRLRILFSVEPILPSAVCSEVKDALAAAVRVLEGEGHELIEAKPPVDGDELARMLFDVVSVEMAELVMLLASQARRRLCPWDFEADSWMIIRVGQALGASRRARALLYLEQVERTVTDFLDEHRADLLLSPTLPAMPPKLGALKRPGHLRMLSRLLTTTPALAGKLGDARAFREGIRQNFSAFPYTPLANVTGQPSMSVPFSWTQEGLPTGIMLTARHGEEAVLLRLAEELEQAVQWTKRAPTLDWTH